MVSFEEKALDLINQFLDIPVDYFTAKQCAIITVKQMISHADKRSLHYLNNVLEYLEKI